MGKRKGFGSDNSATSLLAVSYVVVLGGLTCLFMVIVAREDQAFIFYIIGGAILLLVFSFWTQRDRSGETSRNAWLFWQTQKPPKDPLADYACKKRREAEKGKFGTQKPPAVSEIKEEREHRNWTPPD